MLCTKLRVGDKIEFTYHNSARKVIIARKYSNVNGTGITGLLEDGNYKNFNFNKMSKPNKVLTIPIEVVLKR